VTRAATLRIVKIVHTLAWAVFAGCIFAIPMLAWIGEFQLVVIAAALVIGETTVLALNGWRCPLTGVAARYTDDRRDNFDIYLPVWLARHNKVIFGWLFVAALVFALMRWLRWPS